MDILRNSKDTWFRLRYIPLHLESEMRDGIDMLSYQVKLTPINSGKAYQSMPHERNTAALGSAAEESNLCTSFLQTVRELHHGFPRSVSASCLVVLNSAHV